MVRGNACEADVRGFKSDMVRVCAYTLPAMVGAASEERKNILWACNGDAGAVVVQQQRLLHQCVCVWGGGARTEFVLDFHNKLDLQPRGTETRQQTNRKQQTREWGYGGPYEASYIDL
jgi:hypothetical protein